MDWLLNVVGSEATAHWISEVALSKLMFWSLAFAVAAKFHQREVAKQFGTLTQAINHAAEVLSRRMDGFDERLKKLERQD